MTESKVSLRYARALLNTASDVGLIDTVYNDFNIISKVFDTSREIRNLTASPIFPVWKKKKIYLELFGSLQINELTLKFLILLLDKGRGTLIPHIIKQYYNLYNSINNKVPIIFTTARELNEELKHKLILKLNEYTQKEIIPIFKIEPEIKGGIQVAIDDWVYDASIRNQLKTLYNSLIEKNYSN